jgi:hypothetical protein
MTHPPSAPEWFLERETQVRGLFRDRRRKLPLLACSRCPRDGGLLGSACRLQDGLWVWIAGARMSPSASWAEFRSQYLDVLDESDWTDDTYSQAAEYADEELDEWGGRRLAKGLHRRPATRDLRHRCHQIPRRKARPRR